jgi:pyrroline-5-carboxylate reductase
MPGSKRTLLVVGCGNMGAVIGAGRLMAADERSPSRLQAAIASPGGTTQAGLDVLEGNEGLPACVLAANSAAAKRANELSYAPAQQP